MLAGAIIGLSLVVHAAVDQHAITPLGAIAPLAMSAQQKNAVLQPALAAATECIADKVSSDPRFGTSMGSGNIGDLIVDSMKPCLAPVRALIATYDRLFGEGEGESFFMGPYLDALPTMLQARLKAGD